MRTLLIDNYDSYTYNVFQLMAAVYGREPVVVRNDDERWPALDLGDFDAVVLSPGPGSPAHPRDVGRCRDVLLRADLPVLGVCLGHQLVGLMSGAAVGPAPQPRHGHITRVRHTGRELFAGLPQDFNAVRYHSLHIRPLLPERLEATAWAEDGVIMAVRHRDRPWWGVQFHLESIGTAYGAELLENFRTHCARAPGRGATARTARPAGELPVAAAAHRAAPTAAGAGTEAQRLLVEQVAVEADAERLFADLFGLDDYAVWLDSAAPGPGQGRFSFLGAPRGRLGEVLSYEVGAGCVSVRTRSHRQCPEPGSIFDVLERRLAERAMPQADLPFDFAGGYVGYFGYELKADAGATKRYQATTPDAMWIFVDRFAVIDHEQGHTYLAALCPPDEVGQAQGWLAAAHLAIAPAVAADRGATMLTTPPPDDDACGGLARDRARYLADIAECQAQLRAGESYEICLTNRKQLRVTGDPLTSYRRLRAVNPAPHAAYLRLGGISILSSSPERFLRIDRDRRVESKPIKGTAPRSADPALDRHLQWSLATDAKTRAENLMIVDLVRNDLGRVCVTNSITVEPLMQVESYATVHQLVSTVRGQLRADVGPVGCVAACFPAGSMTGAPKLRTMDIIDRLEGHARGVYAGALGYFSVCGPADLSTVIRTVVWQGGEATIGTGGAIVLGSDPVAEHEEMLLKLRSVLRAVSAAAAEPQQV
jgi:para-aminobenzoate synthetase